MDDNTRAIVASQLAQAYYAGSEPRQGFLGEDRRKEGDKPEGLDLRTPTITPREVYEVFERFLMMMPS